MQMARSLPCTVDSTITNLACQVHHAKAPKTRNEQTRMNGNIVYP